MRTDFLRVLVFTLVAFFPRRNLFYPYRLRHVPRFADLLAFFVQTAQTEPAAGNPFLFSLLAFSISTPILSFAWWSQPRMRRHNLTLVLPAPSFFIFPIHP